MPDETRVHISQSIHKWLKHQHKKRLGKPHPEDSLNWSRNLVEDNPIKLGNCSQYDTMDCALHTCGVSVLLTDNKNVGVLGIDKEEITLAGVEMRRRMAIMMYRNNFMFETDESNKLLDVVACLSGQDQQMKYELHYAISELGGTFMRNYDPIYVTHLIMDEAIGKI